MLKKITILLLILGLGTFFILSSKQKPLTPNNLEIICTDEEMFVCGSDQKTYLNTCEALKAGVSILKNTACDTYELKKQDLENTTYRILSEDKYAKLENGSFENISILDYAFGSLSNEENQDAVVLLKVNEVNELAIVLNDKNNPVYWASIIIEQEIKNIFIKDKTIFLECESSEFLKYKLEGTKIVPKVGLEPTRE
ncbi:MAG: Kazal-type serine protease inhibitor [Candidatus Paceibacterota bacterium]